MQINKTSNYRLLDLLKELNVETSTMPSEQQALVLEKAYGSTIWDVEGRSYIDLSAGFASLAIGHNHSKITTFSSL